LSPSSVGIWTKDFLEYVFHVPSSITEQILGIFHRPHTQHTTTSGGCNCLSFGSIFLNFSSFFLPKPCLGDLDSTFRAFFLPFSLTSRP
jgi:hypothetical protein